MLFFSSTSGSGATDTPYRLLLEAARYADRQGFKAVWVPERHFQEVGGPFPNPAVLAAALAAVTTRVQVRAGSITLPLHDPLRVAEDWAVVDNLSGGRVGLSAAPGWHPGDFVLDPEAFERRREVMFEHLAAVRALWSGTPLTRTDVCGGQVEVLTQPRPVAKHLPVWITTTQNPALWRTAAELNAHVLTALISLDLPTVGQRVREYRECLRQLGRDPRSGIVSLMLHTYVAASDAGVRELVKGPLCEYLRSFLLQQQRLQAGTPVHGDVRALIEQDLDAFIEISFERYYRSGSLIGSPARCLKMLESVAAADVNEIACLIDFGLPFDTVMDGLERLADLRVQWARRASAA